MKIISNMTVALVLLLAGTNGLSSELTVFETSIYHSSACLQLTRKIVSEKPAPGLPELEVITTTPLTGDVPKSGLITVRASVGKEYGKCPGGHAVLFFTKHSIEPEYDWTKAGNQLLSHNICLSEREDNAYSGLICYKTASAAATCPSGSGLTFVFYKPMINSNYDDYTLGKFSTMNFCDETSAAAGESL